MKINLKTGLGLLLLLSMSFHVQAQKDPERKVQVERIKIEDSDSTEQKKKGFQKDKLVFGGNGYPYFTNIGWGLFLNLSLGYRITDKLNIGITPLYQFDRKKYYTNEYQPYDTIQVVNRTQLFGGGIYIRYSPFYEGNGGYLENFFLQAQPGYHAITQRVKKTGGELKAKGQAESPSLLLGGGYITNFGRGPQFFVALLYDVLHNNNRSFGPPLQLQFGVGYAL